MATHSRFSSVSEKDITRAILDRFAQHLHAAADSDVLVVGAGPSGLVAAMDLAHTGHRVVVVERNNYLGGGFWLGGYLMNTLTVRSPADAVLDELGIPHEEVRDGLHVADGPHACSKLIAAACDAGARVLNMTSVEDVVVREARVAGAVPPVIVLTTPSAFRAGPDGPAGETRHMGGARPQLPGLPRTPT